MRLGRFKGKGWGILIWWKLENWHWLSTSSASYCARDSATIIFTTVYEVQVLSPHFPDEETEASRCYLVKEQTASQWLSPCTILRHRVRREKDFDIGVFPLFYVQRVPCLPRLSVRVFRGLHLPLSSELHDPGQICQDLWVLIQESLVSECERHTAFLVYNRLRSDFLTFYFLKRDPLVTSSGLRLEWLKKNQQSLRKRIVL